MFRLLRSMISLALLAGLVWCSFRVPLGQRTFAEHVDRISQTPEAKELMDDARGTVTPVMRDAADRMLGEYIEAPTGPAATPSRWEGPTIGTTEPRAQVLSRVESEGRDSRP